MSFKPYETEIVAHVSTNIDSDVVFIDYTEDVKDVEYVS